MRRWERRIVGMRFWGMGILLFTACGPGLESKTTLGEMPAIDSDVSAPVAPTESEAPSDPALSASTSRTPPLSEEECKKTIAHFKEYDRLMQRARVCQRDADCHADLRVNLCSDCWVMVNKHSRHLKRLRVLQSKYEDDDGCRHHTCRTTYSCGGNPSGTCENGRCETVTDEPMAECGSPSRFPLPW